MEENVRSNSSSADNVNITTGNSEQQADSGQPSDYGWYFIYKTEQMLFIVLDTSAAFTQCTSQIVMVTVAILGFRELMNELFSALLFCLRHKSKRMVRNDWF